MAGEMTCDDGRDLELLSPLPADVGYPPELLANYELFETVGHGGFAKVKLGRHRLSNERVAIKIVDATKLREADLKRMATEVRAATLVSGHPCFVRLYQVLRVDQYLFMIMEFCEKGELFDLIVSRKAVQEADAKQLFAEITRAVQHCHEAGFAHRDIKPENFLLDNRMHIKMIDFGLVAFSEDLTEASIRTACGSAAYAAPEILLGHRYRGDLADCWSLGILLYVITAGFLPFDDMDERKMVRKIKTRDLCVPDRFSPELTSLLHRMLTKNPAERISLDEVLQDPWLAGVRAAHEKPQAEPSLPVDFATKRPVLEFIGTQRDMTLLEVTDAIQREPFGSVAADYALLFLRFQKEARASQLGDRYRHLNFMFFQPREERGSPQASGVRRRQRSVSAAPPVVGVAPPVVNNGRSSADKPMPKVAEEEVDDDDDEASDSSGSDFGSSAGAPLAASLQNVQCVTEVAPDETEKKKKKTAAAASARATMTTLAPPRQTHVARRRARTSGVETVEAAKAAAVAGAGAASEPESPKRRNLGDFLRDSFRSLARGSAGNLDTEPRERHGVFSSDTTFTKPPLLVLHQLQTYLDALPDVEHSTKKFRIRCVFHVARLKMDLEIVRVPNTTLYGLIFHRVKGSTAAYKDCTESVLAVLKL